jgi:hypothetical protein
MPNFVLKYLQHAACFKGSRSSLKDFVKFQFSIYRRSEWQGVYNTVIFGDAIYKMAMTQL